MIFTLWKGPKEAGIAAKTVLGLYLESMLLWGLLWELSWALWGALWGPMWSSERALKNVLGPPWAHLGRPWTSPGPSWLNLARFGPFGGGPQTGPKWAPSRPNLGQIWGHVGPC